MAAPVLPPIGDDVRAWGVSLMTYLRKQLPKLYHVAADDNPSEDGVLPVSYTHLTLPTIYSV